MKFLLLIKAWCKEKKIQTPIEQMTVGQLDVNFRRFYAEARNKAGEPYSKSTLLGFRHSFERYLNRPPFNQGLNLSSDPRFKRSNEMLNAQIVHLKRQGKENVKHKPAIEDEDLKKLKTSQAIALRKLGFKFQLGTLETARDMLALQRLKALKLFFA